MNEFDVARAVWARSGLRKGACAIDSSHSEPRASQHQTVRKSLRRGMFRSMNDPPNERAEPRMGGSPSLAMSIPLQLAFSRSPSSWRARPA